MPHEIAEGFALQHWAVQLAEALRRDKVTVTFLEQPRRLWRRLALTAEIEETMNGLAQRHNHSDDHTLLYVDGGSRGNPGPAAIGGRLRELRAASFRRSSPTRSAPPPTTWPSTRR